MSGAGYRWDPLEALVADMTARTGLQHATGKAEASRLKPVEVMWRHPTDRTIMEPRSITDRRSDIDPFCEVTETVEMAVMGADMTSARFKLIDIWRKAFDVGSIELDDRTYIAAISAGPVRLARAEEAWPKANVVLVNLVTFTWLAPRQDPNLVEPESVGLTGNLRDANGTLQGTVTTP